MLTDYHHFKGTNLSRSEKIQRLVTLKILESPIADDQRENSKVWELKHHSGCVEVGRILAQKRRLDCELAEIICVLHDIYPIETGKYANHAEKGAEIAKEILIDSHDFTDKEIVIITEAIANHSEKDKYSDKPYVELAKDADAFECSLYQGAEGFYRLHKPDKVFKEYVNRIKSVRKELGLSEEPVFRE